MRNQIFLSLFAICGLTSCSNSSDNYEEIPQYPFVEAEFGSTIDLNNLANYANQTVPSYITKDNSQGNAITDAGATLGRVLFYDKNLSSNNTISCASCHKQEFAFSDTDVASTGVNGTTGRHSMRLINVKFATETKFFWNERAINLETQTTMPIKDHGEMGFSGENGDMSFDDLITRLNGIGYYKELFKFVYGTEEITEAKIQSALAQFIRSIQSFDSKYDTGRALAANDGQPFSNFTAQENMGKNLFLTPPTFNSNSVRTSGGLGCGGCHRAPEFDIDPNSLSNGFGGSINGGPDLTNTKAPTLRNLIQTNETLNGPMMHTGIITSLQAAIGHYGNLTTAAQNNSNLDPRLKPNGIGQQLNLNATEMDAVIAFLKTLSGTDVYTNQKWSNPFN
ncbi:cytochrome-c peroxidase [Flavobacterium cyclinae]|uniref:cytochrome-c peroxidase n=1 Tax=Flavobacterium cyclinae TaxID=2895947 RepID=UPI001E40C0B0|nr:cytochrome c peroxidase [Flavobacterium cyclinae]UGS20245.1 cytochrome-c peroxidase [Flavobacterium cyclinae]